VSLRDTRSDFARENLMELASVKGDPILMADWPSAYCTSEFCKMALTRDGRARLGIADGAKQHAG